MDGRKLTRVALVIAAQLVVFSAFAPGAAADPVSTTLVPGANYYRIPTTEKVVALTFDDAWIEADINRILDALEEAGVKATFFPTGAGVESDPETARSIVAEGHDLGSHAYTHSKARGLTDAEILAQIQKTEKAFSSAGLKDPVPLFRAPYGAISWRALTVLKNEGYASIMWTIRGADTGARRTAAQVIRAVMGRLRPGAIIVLHTRNEATPEALPELIRRIKARGYRFVTLSEVLLSPEQRLARYQETSPLLTYLGAWSDWTSPSESGGSLRYTVSRQAAVMVSFTGTTFELLARTGPDCGKVQITIGDGAPQLVDLYSPTVAHRSSVFRATGLADTTHTAYISCTGSKNAVSTGYYVDVDALRVSGSLVQAPAARSSFGGRHGIY